MSRGQAPIRGGAYGLSISCNSPIDRLSAAHEDWPIVEIRQLGGVDSVRPSETTIDEQMATIPLGPARHLVLERAARQATFYGEPLASDLLAHPYIGPVGTVFARWDGRETFHAGAFALDGRAVGVVGAVEAGKSTLLAALTAAGAALVADDLIITDGQHAFAGPRCIDLRVATGSNGRELTPVRNGERFRLSVDPVPAVTPLAGWVFLGWGPGPALDAIPARELLAILASSRGWQTLPSDPSLMLSLSTLPAWRLRRPRDLAALPATIELLIDVTCG